MADVHDSTQIGRGAGETAAGKTVTTSGTVVPGALPDLDVGLGPLGERIAFVGLTAALVAVGVLGILGVVAAVPGNAVSGVFSVVALFGVAAAAPSLARRVLVVEDGAGDRD